MNKVYSVTVEVKLVIRATSTGDALLFARDKVARLANLESLKVTKVFCPADGRQWLKWHTSWKTQVMLSLLLFNLMARYRDWRNRPTVQYMRPRPGHTKSKFD